ncbi:hypothetical protein V0288_11675 [Pannus brasiliensis CCIBt3594]|uniref:Uncharacterized protein n=1 Tax=Pannus brasiliensis CCIBt3594 TaxID=1427578 RepID=A0AAW9QRX2_9CHRO
MKSILLATMLTLFLALSSPVFADGSFANPDSPPLSIGQRVVWNYQPRSNSGEVRKVPAEVVKLGGKQIQIKVRQKNGEFVTRWVNESKLEILGGQK